MKKLRITVLLAVIFGLIVNTVLNPVTQTENYESLFNESAFALLPSVVAIVLALITKEVYMSLFTGVIMGGLIYANFDLKLMINTVFYNEKGGIVAKLTDSGNMGILIFLVMLGIIVSVINKAGGSAKFGEWAGKHIKSKVSAQLATMILGVIIFIDDYFNCLTVGNVMRPVTDKHNVSRAKLAYIIDATAAPICIIAPISSWAAAVTSSVPEDAGINGFSVFIKSIPYNLYAMLTLAFVLIIIVKKWDFGLMKKHSDNAEKGDLFTVADKSFEEIEEVIVNPKAKVIDLLLPVIVLIGSCIVAMLYTGGFFSGVGFVDAFANCDASKGLVLGGFVTLAFTFVYMMFREVLTFTEFTECIPEGFKAMIAPMLILAFAWTLSGMTGILGAKEFVAEMVSGMASSVQSLLPAVIFIVAALLTFATGTSWGTFGILIPIVVGVFPAGDMMVISIAACLAGAVAGDHCSPISDTTIMASAGAKCNHITHVSTQLPYVMLVSIVCVIGYILIGLFNMFGVAKYSIVVLPISIIILYFTIKIIVKREASKA